MLLSLIVSFFNSDRIFSIRDDRDFHDAALDIFRFQAAENPVYSRFLNGLNRSAHEVKQIFEIPFLPVEFFKNHQLFCGQPTGSETIFVSSGTSGPMQSKHWVKDIGVYKKSFNKAFNYFYGDISEYTVLALLPSYLEREGSSLIFMTDELIRKSEKPESGYFLYNHTELFNLLQDLQLQKRKVILIGVTYALLDFAENFRLSFPELIVMETGGMKGKRKELIREELHSFLKNSFGVKHIHSEYGMTELLSQAYSKGDGVFRCPPWMKVVARDTNDPLTILESGKIGGLSIIDLANVHSCSFLATQDLGKVYPDGSFEVHGRFDNSDIRGCNLLVQ